MNRRRGVTLGTTLLVISLLVTLAFTMAGAVCAHLSFGREYENRQEALSMANSALAQGVQAIAGSPTYGTTSSGSLLQVGLADNVGLLTFDPIVAVANGLVSSNNNLAGSMAVAALDGRSVPAFTARLVGEGRTRGAVARVEALVKVPALPAVASDGNVTCSGQVLIAAASTFANVAPIIFDPTAPKLPATLASNCNATAAISLGPGSTITGDVQAVGQVDMLDNTTQILGELRTGCDPMPLPALNVTSFDPVLDGRPYTDLNFTPDNSTVFQGRYRATSDINIPGNLTFNGGFIYVQGNVNVAGGIIGKGAIVATGTITVGNGSLLDAGQQLALIAGGDMTLTGLDRKASYIQGLVYTQGSLSANHLTVVGAVICKNPDGGVNVNDCNMIYLPTTETVNITQPIVLGFGCAANIMGSTDPAQTVFTCQLLPVPPGTTVTHAVFNTTTSTVVNTPVPANFTAVYTDPSTGKQVSQIVANDQDMLPVFQAFTHSPGFKQGWDLTAGSLQVTFNNGSAPLGMNGDSMNMVVNGNSMAASAMGDTLSQIESNFSGAGGGIPVFNVTPDKFLRWEDRIRIALWRNLQPMAPTPGP